MFVRGGKHGGLDEHVSRQDLLLGLEGMLLEGLVPLLGHSGLVVEVDHCPLGSLLELLSLLPFGEVLCALTSGIVDLE